MDNDEIIIAKLLEKIANGKGAYYELHDLLKEITKEGNYKSLCGITDRIEKRIKAEGIAELLRNDSDIVPNHKTYEIVRAGGYLSYIEAKKKKDEREEQHKEIQFKLNRWLYRTKLLPHILSIMAIIISILTLLFALIFK
jgi:hypothetical protein